MVKLKRIYEPADKDDGYRVLVDRLWPRGISKEEAKLDLWLKEIAPSNELRKWFNHDPQKWPEFKNKYRQEIKDNPQPLKQLEKIIKDNKIVTILYGAKDEEHNQADVIIDILNK
jgi:uncharacterized protein YeaO (DUF488 family)